MRAGRRGQVVHLELQRRHRPQPRVIIPARRRRGRRQRDRSRVLPLQQLARVLHQRLEDAQQRLREVVVEAGRSYFDTNTGGHHHFFDAGTGTLTDIPGDDIVIGDLPPPPAGAEIERVDLVIRIRSRA